MKHNQQEKQKMIDAAFKEIVSRVEQYDEDVQFALITQCRLSFNQKNLYVVNKAIFAAYINDNLLLVASKPQLPLATKKELMQRMDVLSFEYPNTLERTKTGIIKYQAKYEWCVQHPEIIAPIAYPELVTVQPSDMLQASGNLLLEYIRRKFCDRVYKMTGSRRIQVPFGSEIADFTTLSFDYPDDIVTEMLNYYGHNRCKAYTEPKHIYVSRIAILEYEVHPKVKCDKLD